MHTQKAALTAHDERDNGDVYPPVLDTHIWRIRAAIIGGNTSFSVSAFVSDSLINEANHSMGRSNTKSRSNKRLQLKEFVFVVLF